MAKEKNTEKEKTLKKTNNKKEELVNEETKYAQKDFFMSYMPFIIIIFFVLIIRIFVATPVRVNGSSMNPTLKNGDTMLLYKLTKKTKGIKRFDIVVIETDSGRLIKRVIGLPGDKIKYVIEKENDEEKGVLYINDEKVEESFLDDTAKVNTCRELMENDFRICNTVSSIFEGLNYEITVPENSYYVMGDNRGNSKDSRMIGYLADEDILGTTEIILFPFGRTGKVK